MPEWLAAVVFVGILTAGVVGNTEPDFPESVSARNAGASRIVSGWEASLGQWPWQLSLRMTNSAGQVSSCGGSVIHEEWGITAAHCTANRVNIIVRAGLVNLTEPEYMFETDAWYNHPSYDDDIASVVQPNDIALLKFKRKITFSKNLQPIRLQRSADMNRNYAGEQLVASGYGLTWTSGSSPEVMNWVYLRGQSNFDCWVTYSFSSIIVDSTICALSYNVTSQSTCQGDSGGPLSAVGEDGVRTLVGVTSFVSGQGCHTEHSAGFIRPGHYHDWIQEVTGINFDWDYDTSEESEWPSPEKPEQLSSQERPPSEREQSSPKESEQHSSEEPEHQILEEPFEAP